MVDDPLAALARLAAHTRQDWRDVAVVGITGSIAAYKAADLCSQLVQLHARVSVILTESATQFIGATTFEATGSAWLALGIGLFSFWGAKNTESFVAEGVNMPDIQHLNLGGADVWLFMGVALLVIGRVFKKGIEIQNENDLTV